MSEYHHCSNYWRPPSSATQWWILESQAKKRTHWIETLAATHMGGDGLWNTGRMQKQNSFVLLRQLGSLSNFHLFLWQLKHLEITFSSMEEWFFFFLPLAVIVIRILISKVECREENEGKKSTQKILNWKKQRDNWSCLTAWMLHLWFPPIPGCSDLAHGCLPTYQHGVARALLKVIPSCHSK